MDGRREDGWMEGGSGEGVVRVRTRGDGGREDGWMEGGREW